ncbi:hypothetical protein ACFSKW_09415 [Nonomuraea mangrovi]|uniref:DUF1579 domain-containing protein n=1 Tax=Nonomuraea mangrovi TaxID=2316207 RepID=A0ABW4SQC7_9ACTN
MPKPHPALQRLDVFVGEWEIWLSIGDQDTAIGRTVFEWTEDGAFLVQRSEAKVAEDIPPEWVAGSPFPVTSVMGLDDASEELSMLYADGRGVHRVYRMSFDGGTWRVWREVPGFDQRFTATFSDGGGTINGYWEMSRDGSTWEHDFDLTYRKVA